ncbi:zinc finger protein 26 [Drosophila grimshawi]|uniref:GH20937 n=1 Tax=Drosophila grimshawi TaxID=7222 RepID=B4J488_DROGR|nr:zinc finger protein 26 [Drosophila grimshawi]XP_043071039.1 zinc finger protein 26 [Drosophila grimshawi]EDW00568.1 GH20937 [Drosophila grimshawi]
MFPLLLSRTVFVVCRCCLVEQPTLCHSIGDNQQLSIELLELVPNLEIKPSDVICQLCLHRLHDALEFRQRCQDSERILRARHEQALDDALECLEREVGCLEQAKSTSMSSLGDPVDFGTLDLSDTFESSYEPTNRTTSSVSWDSGILNTPIHLPASLEQLEQQQQQQQEQSNTIEGSMDTKPKRKRAPRKSAGTVPRSRPHKSMRPCPECGKKYTRNSQLKSHMSSVHRVGDCLSYDCTVCSKRCASLHGLRYHVRSAHSMERPFSCEICDRRFVLRTQLISHARVHTGETKPRIFNCNMCKKTWPTKSDLRTHMRSHDPDKSKRPFKCDKCEKAFFTRGHLNSHHLVHTGEKPFTCTYCDKSYQSIGNLNNHMARMHTNPGKDHQSNLNYNSSMDMET